MSIWRKMLTCRVEGCRNSVDFRGHHNKSRGSSGSDGPWNRIPICRMHHTELHQTGLTKFLEKYPEMKVIFEKSGKS